MKHLTPTETWDFLQRTPEALFVDVRMEIEYLYVGHPPGVVHVAWYEYPEMQAHPEAFAQQVQREAGSDRAFVVTVATADAAATEELRGKLAQLLAAAPEAIRVHFTGPEG